MIVAKKSLRRAGKCNPRGSVAEAPTIGTKRIKVEHESSDEETASSTDDGVRIGRFGNLYHVGSLHVAVLLESTTDCPCAEHKTNQTYSGSRTPTM